MALLVLPIFAQDSDDLELDKAGAMEVGGYKEEKGVSELQVYRLIDDERVVVSKDAFEAALESTNVKNDYLAMIINILLAVFAIVAGGSFWKVSHDFKEFKKDLDVYRKESDMISRKIDFFKNELKEKGDRLDRETKKAEDVIHKYDDLKREFDRKIETGLKEIHRTTEESKVKALEAISIAQESGNRAEVAQYYSMYDGSLRRNDLKGALNALGQAIERAERTKPPTPFISSSMHMDRAALAMQLGLDAMNDLDRAIEEDPKDPVKYNLRGRVKGEKGDHKGAIEDHSKAIELDDKFTDAFVDRGKSRREIGDTKGAIDDLSIAVNLSPQRLDALALRADTKRTIGDEEGADRDFEMIETIHRRRNRQLLEKAEDKLDKGDAKGAAMDATEVIEDDPDCTDALLLRSQANLQRGEIHKANEDMEKAVEKDGESPDLLNRRALVKVGYGNRDGAMEDLRKAIEIDPTYFEAYLNLGMIRCKCKDQQGSIEALTRAIELRHDSSRAYIERGWSMYLKGDNQGAIEDFRKAIDIMPESEKNMILRGMERDRLAESSIPKELRKKITRMINELALANGRLGLALSRTGRTGEAIDSLNISVNLSPQPGFLFERGMLHFKRNDFQNAEEDFTRSLDMKETAQAYLWRSKARMKRGNTKGARSDMDKARELEPRVVV